MTDERGNTPGSDEPPPQPPQPAPTPPPYPYGTYPGGYPPPSPYAGYPPPQSGYPPQQSGYAPQQFRAARGPSNGLGIAALVTAIIGLLLVWSVIGGLVLGAAAVILGFIAHGRCKRGEATNAGVAISGIVLGSLAVLLSVVFIAIWVSLGVRWFNDIGGQDYLSCMQEAGGDQAAQQQCEETFQDRLEDEFGVTPTPTR
ncbi:DUF4190 domain-containing protein [Mycolicibacterium sp. XJ870]